MMLGEVPAKDLKKLEKHIDRRQLQKTWNKYDSIDASYVNINNINMLMSIFAMTR